MKFVSTFALQNAAMTSSLSCVLVLAVLVNSVVSTTVNFKNSCGHTIDLHETGQGVHTHLISNINPGATWIGNFDGPGLNFRHGSAGKGITLAEFTFKGWNNLDNYNLSVIDGFNVGMEIKPSSPGKTVTCRAAGCGDAYLFPSDNSKMHTVPNGGSFTVTFCP